MSTSSPVGHATVLVWDIAVRVFHWSLVIAFAGAWLLAEDGGSLHQAFGYGVVGLVAFRIAWGFAGTAHARFTDFVPSPHSLLAYLRDVMARREVRHLGHNPAGAAMILALLLLLTATGATGWLQTTDVGWGSELLEEVHELFATTTLVFVGLHVAGVILSSVRHRENLVRAMFTGRKRAG
ncbi:MAG: cytochrome b/b6 domain-containing protein [Dokdonella sp.]|uniref:cytochrome b/b6 domain-containing protein n=1 Tax=Dokdonella sp. TaxID=2291710 RepID=UPI0025BC9267|nr:cytochrome b/b6 domain-containing protein [Dokdonella sp.]MBX3699692.1 cytochrome b/b6 domain-containing protein [Dokdonella sp.]MCW5577198.1 cytochrome b/b6 domain-containing protein [Dokdonella sp.]